MKSVQQQIDSVLNFLGHYKYQVVIILGIIVCVFVDDNSVLRRLEYQLQKDHLRQEIHKYRAMHEADSLELLQLQRNPKSIEKIARQRYFMKKDNEDVFVLSTDQQPQNIDDDESQYTDDDDDETAQ